MTLRRQIALLAISVSWLVSGCLVVSASGSFGPVLDPSVVARIVPGETTKREVLSWLGPPEEFVRSEVVESLADETTRVTGAIAVGNRAQDAFSWQRDRLVGRGHVLLVYNTIEADVESDVLVVFFDEQDRVREVAFRATGGAP